MSRRSAITQREREPAILRVRFVYDETHAFEECNGEARPLTEAEYAQNTYRGCLVHPRSGVAPLKVQAGQAWCGVKDCGQPYADLPYAEYCAYYGDPEQHRYLGIEGQRQCPCCQEWRPTGISVWGIDVMLGSEEWRAVTLGEWLTPEAAIALPGFLGEIAKEQIDEARRG